MYLEVGCGEEVGVSEIEGVEFGFVAQVENQLVVVVVVVGEGGGGFCLICISRDYGRVSVRVRTSTSSSISSISSSSSNHTICLVLIVRGRRGRGCVLRRYRLLLMTLWHRLRNDNDGGVRVSQIRRFFRTQRLFCAHTVIGGVTVWHRGLTTGSGSWAWDKVVTVIVSMTRGGGGGGRGVRSSGGG